MVIPGLLAWLLAITVGAYLVTVVYRATQVSLEETGNARPETRLVVWPKWLYAIAVGILAALLLYLVRSILPPFVVGAVLAYMLNPVIERMSRRGRERKRAISLVFLVLAALVVLAAFLIVPLLVSQAQDLVKNYDTYAREVQRFAARAQALAVGYGGRFGLLPDDVFRALGSIGQYLQKWGLGVLLSALEWLRESSSLFLGLLVVAPIVAFWLLRDYHVLGRVLLRLAPEKQRASTVAVVGDVNQIVGGYLLGMATMTVLVGFYASLVLLILGVPFSVLLGLATGLLSIVPYLGFPTAMVIVAITMAVTGMSWVKIAIALGLLVLGNLTSDNVVYPRVIGSRVGLHPLVIVFALMAGGALFGFLGMLLAVPVAGVIKALLLRFWPEVFAAPEGE
jgi:predicted PurR-regulated permease PerM